VISAALTNVRMRPQRVVALARYAELAPHYDASCARISRVRDYALEALNARPGETIIDVACGTGALLPGLAERVGKTGRVIGIEQSPHMASRARKRFSDGELPANVQIVEAPVEEARTRLRAGTPSCCATRTTFCNLSKLSKILSGWRNPGRGSWLSVCACCPGGMRRR